MGSKHRSPLIVWGLFSTVVVLLIASVILFFRPKDRVRSVLDERFQRIDFDSFRSDEVGIVFIGDSLINYSLPESETKLARLLNEEVARQGQQCSKVRVLNLATNGSDIRLMEHHIDRILALRPSLLVVQAEFAVPWASSVGYRRVYDDVELTSLFLRDQFLARLRRFSKDVRKPIASYLPPILRPSPGRKIVPERIRETPDDVDEDSKLETRFGSASDLGDDVDFKSMIVSRESAEFKIARKFIQTFLQKNIPVIVIEIPFSVFRASRLDPIVFEKRNQAILRQFGSYDPAYLRYPKVLPDQYFVDHNHLNGVGKKAFIQWLNPILIRELVRLNRCLI